MSHWSQILLQKEDQDGSYVQETKRKDINDLWRELGHPLEDITQALGKAMGLKLPGALKSCKACTLGKAKRPGVS